MTDGLYGPDGERLAGHLKRSIGIRSTPRPGVPGRTRVGLVIAVYHKDSERNRSESYAEYDVMPLDYNANIPFRRVGTVGNHRVSDSGDYAILRAASEIPDMSDPTNLEHNFMESDGDLVLLDFPMRSRPIILGTVNHLRSGEDSQDWHTDSSDGEVRKVHHKGSHAIMQEDGVVEVDVKSGESLVVYVDGVQILKLYDDGSLKIDIGEGSLEKVILGETFRTWFNTNIANHTHTYTKPLHVDGTVDTGAMGESMAPDKLSDTVKVSD